MLMTVLSFLVTIGVLVVIHEYGHYRAAVACNVKVLRFSVGFGQVLWRRQRGETEFVISALPLGGYVKMLDGREGPVDAAEQHRAFNCKPLRQRAFIVAAGPLANLLLAVLLYAGVNWAGVQELRPWLAQPRAGTLAAEAGLQSRDEVVALEVLDASSDADASRQHVVRSMTDLQWLFIQSALAGQDVRLQLESRAQPSGPVMGRRSVVLHLSRIPAAEVDGRLLDRVGLSGPYAEPLIAEVLPGGPAEQAGLRAGDRVLQVNGVAPADAGQLRQMIRDSQAGGEARALSLQIERAGQTLPVNLLPVMTEVRGQRVPRIEAALGSMPATVEVSYGLVEGLTKAAAKTWDVSVMSLSMLGKMLVGEASLQNLSGPLTIADYAGRSAQMGWVYYVGFLALVSVSLGVLNLLPLPVLDGGHLMYYLFEGVTGRPVSDIWLERLQRGGVAIMLAMMSLALYNDLARLFGAH
ncbi:MAG: RIP metalloprotease RseP [Aquabacterium sp.]|uniref:RIP metalloprotease RseP n=1 Tax=Aquabacterium sp. TaxID=1872578 RepID=UPI002A371163|nr:RIP metalloprotease RseP [Aquabacterium sp.]MDX9842362.1 RIP metalloprotease RseP [Aquabacterium sp.]